ncbi:MAG: hypothetical protein AAGF11_08835 [Myxococcota bacterium]
MPIVRPRPSCRHALLGVILAALGLSVPSAAAELEPEAPSLPATDGNEATPTEPATSEQPPPETTSTEPEPEPEPATCEPACPEGATCLDGQCFVACDPASGECGEPPAFTPEPEPEPEGQAEPAPEPTPDPAADPAAALLGLGLRIAPGVSACLGSGCRELRVGSAAGSMGVGGGLDLRLAYRATPHLSVEVGGLAAIHGNDIDSDPLAMWLAALVGPRLHLSGGRWRAEPVVGLQVGYARSLVRWSNAGVAADGLALGADVGVQVRLSDRVSLGMLTGATLPYWTRVCDVDEGIRDCYRRSELTNTDLRRYFWTTSAALLVRF